MQNCPRCHQSIANTAVTCLHCGTVLKAFGHPGITLHRATEDKPLCATCTYDADDTCTYPQRPHAKECTLYTNISQSQLEEGRIYAPRRSLLESIKLRVQQNPMLLLVGLIAVSVLLALIATSQ